MAYDTCLHPDLIEDMIEELFEIDVISQEDMNKLKKEDRYDYVDPNMLMDVRHKEVKKESLIDLGTERKEPNKITLKMENICKGSHIKVKDLKTIEKEICNTRKCLEDFKNKLEQKNEDLNKSIAYLENDDVDDDDKLLEDKENVDGTEKYLSMVEKLKLEESVHFFNFHLDSLENSMSKNKEEESVKTWRPVALKSPVVNVVTTFTENEGRSCSLSDSEEGLQVYELKQDISQRETLGLQNIFEPYNSPTFNVSVTIDDKYKLSSKQQNTIQKAIITWKSYVKKKKIQKWSDRKVSKLRVTILKKYVTLWISHTKKCKSSKETCVNTFSDTLEIVPAKCCISLRKIGIGNFYKGETEKCNEKIQNDKEQTNIDQVQTDIVKVQTKTQENKKKKTEVTPKKVFIQSKENTHQGNQTKHGEHSSDKYEIPVKTVTPQDVGLVQQNIDTVSEVCKKQQGNKDREVRNITFRSMGEPIVHRFEAQEKIIKQQREVIEKQNRVIFDLQARCLEIESKLNWTLAERQLAEAERSNKIVSKHLTLSDNQKERKFETQHSKPSLQEGFNTNSKSQYKSDLIVKNMLERQAYCSQLADQTKQRKKRIEEEKERLKTEQEEKQTKEKEDERKKRILQMKLEQQIAKEKEKNLIALKKMEVELTEKALKHYTNNLLCKTFKKLKTVHLEVLIKFEDCDRIYEQKLVRKMFNIWKEKAKESIRRKYEFAENNYSEKLLRLAWNRFCKLHYDYKRRLQVSEDLYNFKLQERMFHRWQTFAAQQFLHACCKIELAERLYRRQLLRHYFGYWRELPRLMFKEREKEQRRRRWREAVQQLIPDFTPAYVDF